MRRNNKGFTLVELIVVIVILAILAAILVPALLGYIDRAKGNKCTLAKHDLQLAVKSLYVEDYARKESEIKDANTLYSYIRKNATELSKLDESLTTVTSDCHFIGLCSDGGELYLADVSGAGEKSFSFEVKCSKHDGADTYTREQNYKVFVDNIKKMVFEDTSLGKMINSGEIDDLWSNVQTSSSQYSKRDLKRITIIETELTKLGFDPDNSSYEASWGTVYDNNWNYGITLTEKANSRPSGDKYIIVTTNGKVTADDDGRIVRAVAINSKTGEQYSGTVEVSTNQYACFSGRTSLALINFKPDNK